MGMGMGHGHWHEHGAQHGHGQCLPRPSNCLQAAAGTQEGLGALPAARLSQGAHTDGRWTPRNTGMMVSAHLAPVTIPGVDQARMRPWLCPLL